MNGSWPSAVAAQPPCILSGASIADSSPHRRCAQTGSRNCAPGAVRPGLRERRIRRSRRPQTVGTHLSLMTRLEQQIRFLVEAEKLKQILRRTRLVEPHGAESRFENTAEHSWHIMLMALVLREHSNQPVDILHVLKMLLVHDLVEIDAGDTPAFGEQGSKEAVEAAAAERIFGLLPEDQREEFHSLWREFEDRKTPEALFANAMDRMYPTFQNLANLGGSWRDFKVTRAKADARLSPIGDGSEAVWDVVRGLLDQAEATGYFRH